MAQRMPKKECRNLLPDVEGVRFEELRPDLWHAVAHLFGPNGACAGYWCMWWRIENRKTWKEIRGAHAKEMFKNLIQKDKAHGILALANDEPEAGALSDHEQNFSRLGKGKCIRARRHKDVWSITCFFIHRKWRRNGVVRGLLGATVETMRKRDVKIVEGYPVTTTKDGRRLSSGLAWTGPFKIFEELGFKTVHSVNPLKPLVRLELKR